MTVYQHVMPDRQADAARLFAAAIDDSDDVAKTDERNVIEMSSDSPVALPERGPLDTQRMVDGVEDAQNL